MGKDWTSFEKYLIQRIDSLETRIGRLEVKTYSVVVILTFLLNFAGKKGWI